MCGKVVENGTFFFWSVGLFFLFFFFFTPFVLGICEKENKKKKPKDGNPQEPGPPPSPMAREGGPPTTADIATSPTIQCRYLFPRPPSTTADIATIEHEGSRAGHKGKKWDPMPPKQVLAYRLF